jgi:hypothetical protein
MIVMLALLNVILGHIFFVNAEEDMQAAIGVTCIFAGTVIFFMEISK